jgi:hypothetical protein
MLLFQSFFRGQTVAPQSIVEHLSWSFSSKTFSATASRHGALFSRNVFQSIMPSFLGRFTPLRMLLPAFDQKEFANVYPQACFQVNERRRK